MGNCRRWFFAAASLEGQGASALGSADLFVGRFLGAAGAWLSCAAGYRPDAAAGKNPG